MSEMYRRNSSGDRTAPCGTPASGVKGGDMTFETLTFI